MIAALLVLALVRADTHGPEPAPTPLPETDARGGVEIHVAGNPTDRAWMLGHVAGFVEQLAVDVHYHELPQLEPIDVLEPPAEPVVARARVWIDLQQPGRAMVYVVDAAWERVLVRRLRLGDGLDEVASEEIGTIVESSVRALLDGGSIGVARAELVATMVATEPPPKPQPPPVPRPRTRAATVTTIGAGYAVAGWATGLVEHGPVALLELAAARDRLAGGGRIEGRFVVPSLHDGDPFALRGSGGGVRLSATLAWQAAPRVGLEAVAGAGVEVVTMRAESRAMGAQAFRAARSALAVVAMGFGPAIEIGRDRDRVLLRAQLTLDVVPHQLRYVTADTGALLLAPWIARPGAALTIAWRRRR